MSANDPVPVDTAGFTAFLHRTIPLTAAMGIHADTLAPDRVVLSAPLDPCINDKGCAFGGAIGSLLTMTCWALPACALRRLNLNADVYIQDAMQRYLAPIWGRLIATAQVEPDELTAFVEAVRNKGKARLSVTGSIHYDDKLAATLEARFVAIMAR